MDRDHKIRTILAFRGLLKDKQKREEEKLRLLSDPDYCAAQLSQAIFFFKGGRRVQLR